MFTRWHDLPYSFRPFQGNFAFSAGGIFFCGKNRIFDKLSRSPAPSLAQKMVGHATVVVKTLTRRPTASDPQENCCTREPCVFVTRQLCSRAWNSTAPCTYPQFDFGGMPGFVGHGEVYFFLHRRAPFPFYTITCANFNPGHQHRANCLWAIQSKRMLRDEKATVPANAPEQRVLGPAGRKADHSQRFC